MPIQNSENDNPIWQTEEGKYFTEIEEYFSRKRALPTILSPNEWFLIKSWYDEGIPLSIIKKAIDKFADKKEFEEKRISLFYIRNEVIKEWFSYKKFFFRASISKTTQDNFARDKNYVIDYLDNLSKSLEASISSLPTDLKPLIDILKKTSKSILRLKSKIKKVELSAEEIDQLDNKLIALENSLIKKITDKLSNDILSKLIDEAKEILCKYDNLKGTVAYSKIIKAYIKKSLLKKLNLPKFSIYHDLMISVNR